MPYIGEHDKIHVFDLLKMIIWNMFSDWLAGDDQFERIRSEERGQYDQM